MSPVSKHAFLQRLMANRLKAFAEPRELGEAFTELRFTFAGRSIVPDVAFRRAELIQVDDRGQISDEVVGPPDLMVEILSPDQSPRYTADKLTFAVENGCAVGWLIDPYGETITVFAPDQDPMMLNVGAILEGGAALPGFQLPVEEVFGWLKRPRRRGPGA
jgi:Uma2 family endonuclease